MTLIDTKVKTFLAVAREGSFSKAAKSLYLSPVSVMNQIRTLESEIGSTLLDRSPCGCTLTRAGVALQEDTTRIVELSREALSRQQAIRESSHPVIRVGTSLLRPCRPLMDLVARRGPDFPFRIEIVPFSDDPTSLQATIANLGNDIDCFVGPCGSRDFVNQNGLLVLGTYDCCIAVARSSELAQKARLTWDDLEGQRLMLIRRGDSLVLDRMRDEIARSHPGIEVVDAPHFYDAKIFNECEREGVAMETLDAWADVHPGVITIPMDWGYQMPYGIIYAKKPSTAVQAFIRELSSS